MANIEVTVDSAPSPAQPSHARANRLLLALGAVVAARGVSVADYTALKDALRGAAARDPIDALLATVLGGGMLFYALEHETNPRCRTYWDAVLYVATSLSVGYDDVFPKTRAGNALAALVQSFGPALAAGALGPTAATATVAAQAAQDTQAELLAVNRAILAQLEALAARLPPGT